MENESLMRLRGRRHLLSIVINTEKLLHFVSAAAAEEEQPDANKTKKPAVHSFPRLKNS